MIGKALRLMRELHNIKAIDIAKKMDVSTSYVSEIETGKKEPTMQFMTKYCEQFGMKPSTFLLFAETLEDGKPITQAQRRAQNMVLKMMEQLHRQKFGIEGESK